MTTKTVGVRELKEQAPKLVQRAERGERILITRHGRPAAVLAPAGELEPAGPSRPRLRAWERERRSFEKMAPKLERRYWGKFVAVLDGRVIDSDPEPGRLFERVAATVPRRVFFIGSVGATDSVVDVPGFSVQ